MKLKLSALLLLYFALLFQDSKGQARYQSSPTRLFDLIHTQLDLKPNWTKNELNGIAILSLKPYFYPQSKLVLDAKAFDIESILVNGISNSTFTYDQKKITIELGKTYTRQDTLTVTIQYIAKPNEVANIEANKHKDLKGLYFIEAENLKNRQLWSEGETEYNSCWFPTIDAPNEKHTQLIKLTVDSMFTTLSNGLLLNSKVNSDGTRTDTWQQKLPHAVYLTSIAIGDFVKVIDPASSNFEISYYVEPQFKDDAIAIFGHTPEMIAYFEKLLNYKYPWAKYSQIAVKDYISGAMENTSATTHGSGIQKKKPQLIDNTSDGVIAHELFHHWFGDLVTCESWANLSLNEAFADYSEQLWFAHKYGKDEGDFQALNGRDQYFREAEEKKEAIIRFNYEDKEDMFDSHTYSKGGRVLHMLRRLIGDQAFFGGLNLYLTSHAFESVEVHDLRQAFEEVSGMDLNWFFNQWFLKAGHPDLFVEHSIKNGVLNLYVEQTNVDSSNTAYEFPLEVLVGTPAGQEFKTFWVDESEEYFEMPLGDTLSYISIDPNGSLLAMVDHVKTDQLLLNQFLIKDYIAPRIEAFRLLTYTPDDGDGIIINPVQKKEIREMVLKATEDSFWRIRDMAVQKLFDYDGDDFLKVEKQLQSVIKTDARSQVRASGILAMRNFLNAQNDLLFRNALKDSTYLVQAAALESILINNPPDADAIVSSFKEIDDVNIFGSVANFIATKGSPNDFDWFKSKLKKFSGGELYQVLGTFGNYLIQTDNETKLKAIPFLQNIATNESMWFVRFQAGQTLMLISDLPEALQAAKEVIEQEKEERLLNLYKQFPLD